MTTLPHLSFDLEDAPQAVDLGERTTIGRDARCDVVLPQSGVSREHAVVERTARGGFELVDLQSAQGSFVNGTQVTRFALNDGDVISLGGVQLRFATSAAADSAEMAPVILLQETDATVLRLSGVLPEPSPDTEPSDELGALRSENERQGILLELMRATALERDPSQVMERIVEAVFALFPAERAAILTYDKATGRPRPAIARQRSGASGPIVLSESIVREVVESGEAVLAADAGTDLRFRHAESVQAEGIRSAMCAPLLSGADLVGVLHVDSQSVAHAFSAADLQLFRSLSGHAALAVHRLRLDLEDRTRWAGRQSRMALLGQLAGRVSHDFNNSLAAIQAYAELIDRQLPDGSEARTDVAGIIEAVDGASEVTRQLLAFARREVVAPVTVAVDLAVRESHELLQRMAGEQVTLRTPASGGACTVRIDPTRLQQVVANLVMNARNASAPGRTITIEAVRVQLEETAAERARAGVPAGAYVRLAVRDQGCGMEPAVAARAFDPFFTTRGSSGGTGLGLATVYGIVTQAGGGVTLESEVGAGTSVLVYLPFDDEAPAAGRRRTTSTETAVSGAGDRELATVLVAEDDPMLNRLVCRGLELGGYAVLQARSGEEALKLAERHGGAIEVVVSDVIMPGLSGPEWVEQLRALRPAVGVVYMSGYPDTELEGVDLDARSELFLAKPFPVELLLLAVGRVLRRARKTGGGAPA